MFTSSVRLALLGAAALFFAADLQAVEGHAAAHPSTLQASRAHHDRFVVKRGPAPPIKRNYAFKRSTPHEMPRATSTPVVKRANPWTPNVLPLVRGVSKGRAAGSRAALARAATTPATTTASAPSFVKRLLNDLLGEKNDAEPQGDSKPDEETPTGEDVPDAQGTPDDGSTPKDEGTGTPDEGGAAGGVADLSLQWYTSITIGSDDFTVQVDVSEDGIVMSSPSDAVQTGWDPSTDPDAQAGAQLTSKGGITGTEYAVTVNVGGFDLADTSVVSFEATSDQDGLDYTGALGLGLKGSGIWGERQAPSALDVVGTFGLVLLQDGTGSLTMGSSPEGVPPAAAVIPSSSADRWTVTGKFNGQRGTADFNILDPWMYGDTDSVTQMIQDAGLEPKQEDVGDGGATFVTAVVDCDAAPEIKLELDSGDSLSWSGAGAAVKQEDGTCLWLIKGADPGDYPTAFSLGAWAMSWAMTFNGQDSTISIHPDAEDSSGSGSDGSAEGGQSEGEDGQGTDSTETGDDTEAEDGSGDTTTSTEDGDEDVNSTEEGDGS